MGIPNSQSRMYPVAPAIGTVRFNFILISPFSCHSKISLTAAYLDLRLCARLVHVGRVLQLTTTVACAG